MSHFEDYELECKCGCGKGIEDSLLVHLEDARELAGVPFVITSGARCKAHNEAVGGSPTSSHVKGLAVDIRADDSIERFKVLEGLIKAGFNRVGIAKNFIHADIDEDKTGGVAWLY